MWAQMQIWLVTKNNKKKNFKDIPSTWSEKNGKNQPSQLTCKYKTSGVW